jgi:dihydroorotase (multifunctional complex type)
LIVDSVIVNAKAYMRNAVTECSIAIDEGKIFKIGKEVSMPKSDVRFDLKNLLVLPGLIDVHVHLRDEGKSLKEDFFTGTAAASAGGFASVVDMPNNEPVTMSAETLRNRMRMAERRILVDVGFRSEFPRNLGEIEGIVKEGAFGFKLFMADQVGGVDVNDDEALLEAFRIVGKFGLSTAVHAEDMTTLKKAEDQFKHDRKNDLAAFLRAHSPNVELKAAKRMLSVAKQTAMHLHFCHVSTREALDTIVEAKSEMPLSCEATPHNLLLSSDDLKRIGTLGLTMPPIRDTAQVASLWDGIERGWIDIIASDHAPHTLKEKEDGSVWDVKVGVPGLETTLPLLLTEVKRGRLSIGDIVRLLSEKPSQIFKMKGKGQLREENHADLTVVDLRRKFNIDSSKFKSKAKFSPFDGREVEGRAVKTFVRGQLVMDEGEIVTKAGSGKILRRE